MANIGTATLSRRAALGDKNAFCVLSGLLLRGSGPSPLDFLSPPATSFTIKTRAASVLGNSRRSEALAVLSSALESSSSDEYVASEIVSAIGKLNCPGALEVVIRAAGRTSTRSAALGALAKIADATALPALTEAFFDGARNAAFVFGNDSLLRDAYTALARIGHAASVLSEALKSEDWHVVYGAATFAESIGLTPKGVEERVRSAAILRKWSLVPGEGPVAIPYLVSLADDPTVGRFYTLRRDVAGTWDNAKYLQQGAVETLGLMRHPEAATFLADRLCTHYPCSGPEIRALELLLKSDPSCVTTLDLWRICDFGRYQVQHWETLYGDGWRDCSEFQNLVRTILNRRCDRDTVRISPGVNRLKHLGIVEPTSSPIQSEIEQYTKECDDLIARIQLGQDIETLSPDAITEIARIRAHYNHKIQENQKKRE